MRLKQRFGLRITKAGMQRVIDEITSGKLHTVSKYARGSALNYIVTIKGKRVLVAFNHHRKHLITAMIPAESKPKKEPLNKEIFDRPIKL